MGYFAGLPYQCQVHILNCIDGDVLALCRWMAAAGRWVDDGLLGDPDALTERELSKPLWERLQIDQLVPIRH